MSAGVVFFGRRCAICRASVAGQVRRSGGKCSSRVEAEHGEYAPALALLMLLDCGHTGNYKQPQSLLQLLLGCHPSGEPF